jgi:hypothetical protein
MCSRSCPGSSKWKHAVYIANVSARLDYCSGVAFCLRKTGSLHFCVVLSFPHDTSGCYQAMVAVDQLAVFCVVLLAKSCSKVQPSCIRQIRICPLLQCGPGSPIGIGRSGDRIPVG